MTDTSDRELGRRIATLRKQRGWSQSFLASLVGIDQSVLSRIEAGKRKIRARELDQIAKALGTEPAALLPDEAESAAPSLGEPPPQGTRLPRVGEELRSTPAGRLERRVRGAGLSPGERSVSYSLLPRAVPQTARDASRPGDLTRDITEDREELREETYLDLSYRDVPAFAPRPLQDALLARQAEPSRPTAPWRPEAPSLPASVAAVIADYLRLRAMSDDETPASSASWASVDSYGRRRRAGKPSGGPAGRPVAAVNWNEPRDRYARLWRHELGIGVDGPVPDLVALFEDAGIAAVIVARLDRHEPVCANVTAPAGPDDVSFLFVNADRPVTLQRHALVHAFAHLALGHGDVVDRRIEWSRATPLEVEANDFAEEFLAPTAAVARWYDRHGDPRPDVDMLLDLAAAFGITFWAAYYRSRATGHLGEKPAGRLMRELRARQWSLLPEQSYRGGLRDTLSTLGEEAPLPPPGALGVGGVPAPLTRDAVVSASAADARATLTPAVLRVPSRLRLWTLQELRRGRLSLEEAAAALRRSPAELAAELTRLGLE